MTGVIAVLAAARKLSPITVDADWGLDSIGAYPGTPASASRTLTVPVGNPGNITLGLSGDYNGTPQYRKNAGTWTTFANGDPLTVATASTLEFRNLNMASATSMVVTVTDATTSTSIGGWTGLGV